MPQLTAVLVYADLRERAAGALDSILRQDAIAVMEVIAVDLSGERHEPLPGTAHPSVRALRMPAGTTFAAAKTEAVRIARAPVIAFLEEHCRALDGWAAALIEAHRGAFAAIGCETHNANPESHLSRTIHLMNYTDWSPPAPRREESMLPGHNASFKRDVLMKYESRLPGLFAAEVVLHGVLQRDGYRLTVEPSAKFEHINETSLRSISYGYFLWHRIYGPARAREFGWSVPRRIFYAAATPLIPLYYIARLTRELLRKQPARLTEMFAGLHQIFVAQLASACGQAMGLLFGSGDAEREFTAYELNTPR